MVFNISYKGFCSSSRTSSTSLPTPTSNMDSLPLLDAIHENEGVVTTPSRTIVGGTQKRLTVGGSTQTTDGSDHPQLTHRRLRRGPTPLRAIIPLTPTNPPTLVLLVEFTNSTNSPIHASDPLVAVITPKIIHQS
ncbi:hypothetical protein PVK06_027547 [Gossypium arboreum]|uniref:Uncharacterized protein n=1 Tax=Gossypium arboreum TaxID=29729 RepID=A0ABR0P0J7_GOSAR|nr:hypothetical protein PVK06_027547 [Gossypium arboreum]